MTPSVFILGAGRAGRSLARALVASGVDVVGLHGRRAEDDVVPVSAGRIPVRIGEAGVVLLTVRDVKLDDAIVEVAASPMAPGAVVLHASGATDPAGLATLRAAGHPCGTLHPLVPLADPARAAEVLRDAWIGVDGDPPAVAAARELVARLGAHALLIPPGEKPRYHAAAVFAANFPIVLSAFAGRLLREAGVDDDDARRAVHRLMAAAAENVRESTPQEVLTGPIARGDVASVRRHLEALAGDPLALELYVTLSRAAPPLAREQGTPASLLREIELALASLAALGGPATGD